MNAYACINLFLFLVDIRTLDITLDLSATFIFHNKRRTWKCKNVTLALHSQEKLKD